MKCVFKNVRACSYGRDLGTFGLIKGHTDFMDLLTKTVVVQRPEGTMLPRPDATVGAKGLDTFGLVGCFLLGAGDFGVWPGKSLNLSPKWT